MCGIFYTLSKKQNENQLSYYDGLSLRLIAANWFLVVASYLHEQTVDDSMELVERIFSDHF